MKKTISALCTFYVLNIINAQNNRFDYVVYDNTNTKPILAIIDKVINKKDTLSFLTYNSKVLNFNVNLEGTECSYIKHDDDYNFKSFWFFSFTRKAIGENWKFNTFKQIGSMENGVGESKFEFVNNKQIKIFNQKNEQTSTVFFDDNWKIKFEPKRN